jgi:hypothetical protein
VVPYNTVREKIKDKRLKTFGLKKNEISEQYGLLHNKDLSFMKVT